MAVAFRIKLFTDGCHRGLSRRLSTLAVRAGVWQKSRWQVNCCWGGLCLLVCWRGLRLLNLSSRSSWGPPDDRPCARLKTSTPHEAPTPALRTKTLVLTTANRRSTRTEATWRALSLKTAAKREDCVVLEALYQHREATSHPSSHVGAWALHCCDSTRWPWAGETPGVLRWDVFTQWRPAALTTASRAFCHQAWTRSGEPATLPPAVWAECCALVFTSDSPRLINPSLAAILSNSNVCTLPLGFMLARTHTHWEICGHLTLGASRPWAWLKTETVINYLSFDTVTLCGRENYKYIKLFTNFVLFTHDFKRTKEKTSKQFAPLPPRRLIWVKSEIFTNFLFLALVRHHM